MYVLIIGGEPAGAQLALSLVAQDYKVRLIENRPQVLSNLHRLLPTEVIYEGNSMDLQILELAKVREADVFVAATDSDADNLVLCALAHQIYHVGRTIARVNDPAHAWLFDDKFYVDVALNESFILAHLIEEEMSLGDMMTLLKLRRGQYSLVEVRIPDKAKGIGIAIRDLTLPQHCIIAGENRQNEMILPSGATVFQAGDEVLALTDQRGEQQLQELFTD